MTIDVRSLHLDQAFSVTERVAGVERADETLASPSWDLEANYAVWRSLTPFAGGELAGPEKLYRCDPETLKKALADPPLLTDLPGWVAECEEILEAEADASVKLANLGSSDEARVLGLALAVGAPFLRACEKRIIDGLAQMEWAKGVGENGVSQMFMPVISWRLLERLLPALLTELNLAARANLLRGATPEERFDSFVDQLHSASTRLRFFARYPVLSRHCTTLTSLFSSAVLDFAIRFDRDLPTLRNAFKLTAIDQVVAIYQAGEPHAGGRNVLIVEFQSGRRIVYKPRPLDCAAAFQSLLAWMNAREPPLRLKTITIVPREGYGWVEYVERAECADAEAVRRFFRREGALMAVLHIMSTSDVHHENLIAAGEYPVLVDLESLLQPEMSFVAVDHRLNADAQSFFESRPADSLQRMSLLPHRAFARDGMPGPDMSGIGGGGDDTVYVKSPDLVALGTDEMRIVLSPSPVWSQGNRPFCEGQPQLPSDYRDDLLAGFEETCWFLAKHCDALLVDDGPVASFGGCRVRVVVRSTMMYGTLLRTLARPDLVASGLATDFQLDRFLTTDTPATSGASELIVRAERDDLWRGDVPIFQSEPDSADLWTSDGTRISSVFSTTGMDIVARRLKGLKEYGPHSLIWEIDTVLDADAANVDLDRINPVKRTQLVPKQRSQDRPRALDLARLCGERIVQHEVLTQPESSWMCVNDSDAGVHIVAITSDLYAGLAGITLFLAYLGWLTRDDRFTHAATRGLSSARRFVEYSNGTSRVGAFSGLSGYIYLLLHLGAVWRDAGLVREAARYGQELRPLIERDEEFDVIAGAAGAIPVLLALNDLDSDLGAFEVALECGQHLVRSAQAQKVGAGWVNGASDPDFAPVPVLGLAHGVSGIAWALFQLHAATNEDAFRNAGLAALAYERRLFDRDHGGWPDLRDVRMTARDGGARPQMSAWCTGAAGIGLTRCRIARSYMDDLLRKEIRDAVRLTLEVGFGNNHSLCHGDLGNRELLVEAAHVLNDADLRAIGRRIDTETVVDIAKNGYKTGVRLGVDTPDLMRGTAGIGFGLLRIAAPAVVPSIVMLDPPLRAR